MPANYFDLVVLDVDGTLYPQKPLRQRMLVTMLYALVRGHLKPSQAQRLRVYRQYREKVAEVGGSVEDAVSSTAFHLCCSEQDVLDVENEWLLRRPLAYLQALAFPEALSLVDSMRERGLSVVAWSDYPACDKLQALGFRFDHVVSANDPDVRKLKPHPAGLIKSMDLVGTCAERTLLVGDRDDRDGRAARAVNVQFVLAEKGIKGSVIGAVERALNQSVD